MRTRTRLLLSALVAALTLSAAISTAHARRFELSNQRFRVVWSRTNPLFFVTPLATIRCSVSIEGSFHSRTLSKVSGQLVGYVTSAHLARPCTGGEAWVQNGLERLPNGTTPTTLPWHIRYDRFIGALPTITRIRLQLIGAGFLIRVTFGSVGCLVKTTDANPGFGFIELGAGGVVTGLTPDPAPFIPPFERLEGVVNCPEGQFEGGPGVVTLQGSDTTRIIVRLVQ